MIPSSSSTLLPTNLLLSLEFLHYLHCVVFTYSRSGVLQLILKFLEDSDNSIFSPPLPKYITYMSNGYLVKKKYWMKLMKYSEKIIDLF